MAFIDENWCIGCTLCIDACPTDAIIGSNKRMHTVLEAPLHRLRAVPAGVPGGLHPAGERERQPRPAGAAWSAQPLADEARDALQRPPEPPQPRRSRRHAQRLQEKAEIKLADLPAHSQHTDPAVLDQKRAIIEAALLARARAKAGAPSKS